MQRENYQSVDLLSKEHLESQYIMDSAKEITDIRGLPCNYSVVKVSYKHATQANVWGSSCIRIYKDGDFLCEFVRNYPSFHAVFAEQNNTDFLITSGDYQCITIVNLNTGEIKSYVDVDDKAHGCGFCPIYFDWDEDTLYVDGCIWACPEETMICRGIDLNNPIKWFNEAEWTSDDYDDDFYEEDDDWNDDDPDCYCE